MRLTHQGYGKQFTRIAHKLLQAELRSRGLGAVTALEDALEWKRRSLRRKRQANVLRVSDLVAILRHLGIDNSEFMRRVEKEMERRPSTGGGGKGLDGLPAWTGQDDEILARLRNADELRYEDPVAALRAVSELRSQVSRATAHLYFAVGGSCYRSLDLFDKARACLKIAFNAARSERELAICHQRLAVTYVVQEPTTALAEVEKAHDLYAACGDEVGRQTTLVSIAGYSRAIGRLEIAKELATKALVSELLPPRNQVAAHQELALVDLESGQRDAALKRLEMALETAAGVVTDRSTRANLFLLSARAFQSARYYDLSIEAFGARFPFEALGVGLERCQLFADGRERTIRALRAYCRHPAYQRFLDHVYAVTRMGDIACHSFDFSRVRKRWRDSRTRGLKILTVGMN